jgi:hypothetical protein
MKGEKILTVVIPTYNNHRELLHQVEEILSACDNRIIFKINDNFSDIPVNDFLTDFGIDTSLIEIKRNDNNIGADRNVLNSIFESDTLWTWVLSDNDLLDKGAVDVIINVIEENKDALFINLNSPTFAVTHNIEEFYKKVYYPNLFTISNCLYNTSILRNFRNVYERSILTWQGQAVFLFHAFNIHPHSSALFTEINVFISRSPAKWSKINFINATLDLRKYLPEEGQINFDTYISCQIRTILIRLLIISRCYEGVGFIYYLTMLFKIIKVYPDKINKSDIKLFILYLSNLVFVNFYYRYSKIKGLDIYDYK